MDWIGTKEAMTEWFRKYRWAVVVLAAGLVLMVLPGEETAETQPSVVQTVPEQTTLQQELEAILSKVDGAGKVKVLLAQSAGEEIHYQTDEDSAISENGEDLRRQTVIVTGADRGESALVQRVDPPRYLGAVVICQGAGSAAVRLAIVDAVGTVTGLSSDRISVLKMK